MFTRYGSPIYSLTTRTKTDAELSRWPFAYEVTVDVKLECSLIIVMQRLHADDLVAHVQEHESWDVLSFPAIAEQDETYDFLTPYGRRHIHRKAGEILQPALLSAAKLTSQRLAMTDYSYFAQYQQKPQPLVGIIVKREKLHFYDPEKRPERFEQVVQSWDTANKDTELANYSVCTTWGLSERHMYLLDVFRRKLDFPELKRAVQELAKLHRADVVLVEDKASGTSLIQELRAERFERQKCAIPSGGFGKPVVGNDVGTNLCGAEMIDAHGRNISYADPDRGLDPPSPRHNFVGAVREDRIDKAELFYAGGDLIYLPFGMRARIRCPRFEPRGVFVDNLQRGQQPEFSLAGQPGFCQSNIIARTWSI